MKALILNSGLGKRMGILTSEQPKCMTEISTGETILSRQLRQLLDFGVTEVILTTGLFEEVLMDYCKSLNLPLKITFVKNPLFRETNYIYSIYCAREYLNDDLIMMHGDLVFEYEVLESLLQEKLSRVIVSTTLPLPQKDFKAVILNNRVEKIGVEFFENAVASQPLYFFKREDWLVWLVAIISFVESGKKNCYAENALNEVSDKINLQAFDVREMLCREIDTPEDLSIVKDALENINRRTVYMCFSTDILHSGHMELIKKARRFGKIIVGIMTDEAVASYKRYPLVPFEERKALFENIAGVWKVVTQRNLSYRENLERYKPNFVIHGDDWREGFQKPVRNEVLDCLAAYGGRLIEFPYSRDGKYKILDLNSRAELSLPDMRRIRLKKLIEMKGTINAIEVHNGLTGLLAEKTAVFEESGAVRQFDAMWFSSLCDSTSKGKPDIELVDMTSRFQSLNEILEVTTKPIIFDGDTGGLKEHFIYTVRTLERMGISMVIIEDKTGLKKNSLFGTEVQQTQESIENFCEKISAGKKAQITTDFMICARIESLILERAYSFRSLCKCRRGRNYDSQSKEKSCRNF